MSCIDAGSEARSAGQETHSASQETRPGSQEKPQESPGLVAILENRVACNEARANGAETLLRVNEARWELTNDRLKKADGQLKAHKEMLYQLRARSEPEREMIFWMIKQGQEAESILNQIADRHFLLQLGPVPDTRLSYDFPYMPHMPKYILTTPDNEYLTSAIYEVTARQRIRTPGVHQPIHRIPYHAAEIVEPLLDVARPAQWTAIVVDPKVYRRLLSLYFLHDYMSNPVFHKDVFLHDLASGRRGGFCSSVLVNAILAKACVSVSTSCLPLCTFSILMNCPRSTAMPSSTAPSSGYHGTSETNSCARHSGSGPWNWHSPSPTFSRLSKRASS